MRHKRKNNHLGRTTAHRDAMLSNMATSLIMHKRIFTTVPKAKELRKYVEPLITRSKEDTTNSRRIVFSKLQNKYAVAELFQNVSPKVSERPGGYTRILKTGYRLGDNAAMCFIELVDFNENMLSDGKAKKTRTRRSRRKSTGDAAAVVAGVETPKAKEVKEVKEAEEVVKDEVVANETTPVVDTPVIETSAETVVETAVETSNEQEVPSASEESTTEEPKEE